MPSRTPTYVLDSQTKKGLRITSFADDIASAVEDFQDWTSEISARPHDIWYANVFNFATKEHIAIVHIDENNTAIIEKAPANSKEIMFRPKRLKALLKGELK